MTEFELRALERAIGLRVALSDLATEIEELRQVLQAHDGTGEMLGRVELALQRLSRVLADGREPVGERPPSACTTHVAHLIDQRYMHRLTLASLAQSVREPRGRMMAAFRQETGSTIHAYLTRVRLEHAAERLFLGEKVEAVMLCVGYHSKRSFYRQFRTLTGLTPGAYRDAAQAFRMGPKAVRAVYEPRGRHGYAPAANRKTRA